MLTPVDLRVGDTMKVFRTIFYTFASLNHM